MVNGGSTGAFVANFFDTFFLANNRLDTEREYEMRLWDKMREVVEQWQAKEEKRRHNLLHIDDEHDPHYRRKFSPERELKKIKERADYLAEAEGKKLATHVSSPWGKHSSYTRKTDLK